MNKLKQRKFELHSKSDDYLSRIEKAKSNIQTIYDEFTNPCINYSGGKDSLVLLHLISQKCRYKPDIYHFDNGILKIPESDEFVRESVSRIGGDLYIRSSEKANSEKMVNEEGHGYKGFFGWYKRLAQDHDWDVRILGIRAEESGDRERRFDSSEPINYGEQFIAAAPIHHLTTTDIWSYIYSNSIEYHPIYDTQAELYGDIEHQSNRLVTLYDSEFDSLGSRTISKFIYPSESYELKELEK